MFTCPTCESETSRLIGPKREEDFVKLRCPKCYDLGDIRPTYLHQRMEGASPWNKNLTVAKAGIIDSRRVSPDDKSVVIDRRTGKETQY